MIQGVRSLETSRKAPFWSWIRFERSDPLNRVDDEGRREARNWTEVYFEPIEGRLLLFPSWLMHEVEPNLAAETGDAGDRISISFNIMQRRRDA